MTDHLPIRGLTVRQPWCAAIAHLRKPVENRSWQTSYRGLIAVHAGAGAGGKREYASAVEHVAELSGSTLDEVLRLAAPRGVVIAVARLADVCSVAYRRGYSTPLECDCGPWAVSRHRHFRLADVRPLAEPVPCKGALGLWKLPEDVEAAVRGQLAAKAVNG